MALKGTNIAKGQTGPNISGEPFKISGLLTTGIAVADKLTLGAVYTLNSEKDCAALGLDKDYDVDNNVVVYEHIEEYFRMARKTLPRNRAPKLYLMVADQDTVMIDDLVDVANAQYAKKLITEADGEIHNLMVGFNPAAGYVETVTDGINTDVRAAIVKAQALHEWAAESSRPVQIYLEGRAYDGDQVAALDLRAIPGNPSGILEADKVSIVIAQDYGFAETLSGLAQLHAAIGTFGGTMAACDLNQHPGEVETFNITDELAGKWLVAGLSSHEKVKDIEATLETLTAKGYIFADTYVDVSGYRWNDDATCTPIIVDSEGNMNQHTISYGRPFDYARRLLNKALLTQVKKVKPVNSNGKMPTGVIKDLDGLGKDVFDDMVAEGWISSGEMFTDPDSDILVAKQVDAEFYIIPYGNIGFINGTLNLRIRA